MRHRFGGITGLGNPEPEMLDNNKNLCRNEFWDNFLDDAMNNFKTIAEYEGFDFHADEDWFKFGVEPTYEGDDLQIIAFNLKDKSICYIEQGKSFGAYGSIVVSKTRFYGDYKNKSKFIKFIDKWYDQISVEVKKLK